jgi:Carboxypeptidase regulatory-like domain
MKMFRYLCGALVILLSCSMALGQTVSTSQITGVVKDSAGAVVPNADVVLSQTDTGQTYKVKSNGVGQYILPNLPNGTYNLQVTSAGFETYIQRGIVLDVGSNPEINVALTVGAVTESVVIQAVNANVETQSTGIGQVIDQTQVVELPLNGRDADQLIALAGATTTAVGGDLNSNKNFPTIAIAVAGGLPNGVAFVLDGATHNESTNNLNLPQPMPDALQEFKVETSALPAQYGDHAAAAVNAITKSGTNKFHGDAFEFIRNYALNALGFFGNYATSPYKDGLKRNQFGGTIGGPILKNKLFFFGGFQDTIVRATPLPTYTQVPTVAMMAGDFSTVTSTACNSKAITLAAPFTTIGGVPNQLPSGSFSQQALAAMKFIPIAGSSAYPDQTFVGSKGAYSAACGYVAVKVPGNSRQDNAVGRVDYTLGDKDRIFGRYFLGINSQPIPPTPNNALTENAVAQYNRDQGITLGETHTITSNLINSTRLSVNRVVNLRVVDPFFDPSTLGVNTYNAIPGYTALSVTGGFGVGGGTTNPGHFNSTTWQFVDDVTYIHGSHEMAAGVDYIYALMATVNNRPANGIYSFTGAELSSNGSYGYGDFFAGALDSFSQGLHDLEDDGQTTVGLYAQDRWKATKNLTINYGLRWEPYLPEHNSEGHVENFTLAAFTAGTTSKIFTQAPAGLLFQGDPGQPSNHYTFGNKAIFEPRVGLIWDPFGDGKTSIRGGFGMFYDTPQLFFNTRYSNSPPYGDTIALNNVSFANPWATYTGGDPFPALNTLSNTAPFAQEGVYVNSPLHIQPFYLEQWNLSLQRQVGSWLFGAAYLGNRSVHLPTSYEMDPALYIAGTSTGVAGSCGTLAGSNLPKAAAACSTTGNYNARRLLYQQNPSQGVYYSTIGMYDDEGVADYNGMLISVQRRAKQMNIVANYTLAHCLSESETTELTGPSYLDPPAYDSNGRRRSYSNCDSDRRQVANVSLILNAPKFSNHMLNTLASDWSLSTIFTATTGGFSSVSTGSDQTLAGTGNAIAVNPSHPYGTRTAFGTQGYLSQDVLGAGTAFATQCLTATWSCPAAGTFSTQRPLSLVGPSSYELDMSLARTFEIHEAQKIQFRWEAFNVPNEVILSGIGSATANGTSLLGTFTSAGSPRIMQFALKYLF